MYVVLVSDQIPTARLENDDVEIIGPFYSEEAAVDWAMNEMRYIVNVYPVSSNLAH